MGLLYIHVPKCGGTYIFNRIKRTPVNSVGHHRACLQNRNKINFFASVRSPYTWYGSLYHYWKKRYRTKNKKIFNPITKVSQYPYHEFLDIMLHREKFAEFLRQNNISTKTFTNLPNMAKWQCGYPNINLDIGFYTYSILYFLYKNVVFSMSINEILAKNSELLLIKHILKQENLKKDFEELLNKYKIRKARDIPKINKSGNNVTEENTPSKALIHEKDVFVFKVFY